MKNLAKSAYHGLRRLRAIGNKVEYGVGLSFGKNCRIWAPTKLVLGDQVKIGSHVRIEVDGIIGNHVLIASNVGLVGRFDHDLRQTDKQITESRWVGHCSDLSAPIEIGDDVWIGYGATILSGTKVGSCSVVAAGSVVVHDVPRNSVVAGNPAKVVSKRYSDEEFLKHIAAAH